MCRVCVTGQNSLYQITWMTAKVDGNLYQSYETNGGHNSFAEHIIPILKTVLIKQICHSLKKELVIS